MTTKSTALLLAAAAALFAFIWLVEWPAQQAALRPPDRKIIPGLDPAKITTLEIQAGGLILRIEQTNHSWQLTKPLAYPANAAVVEKFLQGLAQWEWQTALGPDDLTNRPNAMEEFGFDPPQDTILLQEEGGQHVLNVGHISPAGDQVYLNPSGSTVIYVASADLLNKTPPANPDWWRDRTVLNLAGTPYETLAVSNAGVLNFDLKRDAATHLWMMTAPLDHRADTPKIDALLARLQGLTVSNFVPDGSPELDSSLLQGPAPTPLLELKFLHNETNIALDLKMGASPTNNPKLAFARRLSPANMIEIARDPLLPWEASYTNFLDHHLTSLSPSLLDSIQVTGEEKFTVQKTTNGSWVVMGPETFPADARLMQGWLAALTNIEVDIPYLVEADLAGFGLDKPRLEYDLAYAAPPGQTNPADTRLFFGTGTNQPDTTFERRSDERSVNTISLDQLSQLPGAYWELRDRSIWRFETNEVDGIDVQQRGTELKFRRDTHEHWRLAAGPDGFLLIPAAIEETLYRMGRLQAVYWSGVGEDNVQRFGFDDTDYRISFLLNQGGQREMNTIEFGHATPLGHPYASVVRDGRRLVFEFPVDLYIMVKNYLGVPPGTATPH